MSANNIPIIFWPNALFNLVEIFFVRNCPPCPRIALSQNCPTSPYLLCKLWTHWKMCCPIIIGLELSNKITIIINFNCRRDTRNSSQRQSRTWCGRRVYYFCIRDKRGIWHGRLITAHVNSNWQLVYNTRGCIWHYKQNTDLVPINPGPTGGSSLKMYFHCWRPNDNIQLKGVSGYHW